MKAALLFINLVAFMLEVGNPSSRFIRVGAPLVPKSQLSITVRDLVVVNKKGHKEKFSQVKAADETKDRGDLQDPNMKKSASHKAAPRRIPSAPVRDTVVIEKLIVLSEPPASLPDDILQPPIHA